MEASEDLQPEARHLPWLRFGLLPILLIPGAVCVGLDFALRGDRICAFLPEFGGRYAAAALESFLVWGALLFATTTSRAWLRWGFRLLFVGGFTLALGGQVYFFGQYRAYLTRSVATFAVNMIDSVRGQLLADVENVVRTQLPFAVIASMLVLAVSKRRGQHSPVSRGVRLSVPLLLLGSAVAPVHFGRQQAATPDALYLNALGAFVRTATGFGDPARGVRPRARHSLPLSKPSVAESTRSRNVLLVITESVRADAYCLAGEQPCLLTPATHALLPERVSFTRARSLSSTTAISVAVLWSGLFPTESTEILHSWPLLFDYARAAGWDTAYWTSQNLLFGNTRLWVKNLGARLTTSATELDPEADVDLGADEALLARHVSEHIAQLREPFLAVVHLSNTHYPYFSDARRGEPSDPAEAMPLTGSRAYRRAIFQQDLHVARMLSALRATEPGKRTVVVLTSDHGEAFQEHRQSGHTLSVYDEELRVPCFVDAPEATLSDTERHSVLSRQHTDVFHTDVVPTILDLMGVLDAKQFAGFTARLSGQSWLRPARSEAPVVPITNCSPLWSCAFENWGVIRGPLKLIAQTHPEHGERCFNVVADPGERAALPISACAGLRPAFYTFFSRLPE